MTERIKVLVAENDSENGDKYETLDPIRTPTEEEVAELVSLLKELRTHPYFGRTPFMTDEQRNKLSEKEDGMREILENQENIVVDVLKILGQTRIIEKVEYSNEQID